VGLDAHGPGHTLGSSHGDSRIYRRAYWEGGHYVPLLNRAYDGWRALDEQSSERVFVKTGGLFVGRASSTLVRQSRATAVEHAIAHELIDADELHARFPAFRPLEGVEALYEPDALMLFADAARAGFLAGAASAGAGRGQSECSTGSGGGGRAGRPACTR
jgi:sarcosine oxidase